MGLRGGFYALGCLVCRDMPLRYRHTGIPFLYPLYLSFLVYVNLGLYVPTTYAIFEFLVLLQDFKIYFPFPNLGVFMNKFIIIISQQLTPTITTLP